MSAKKKLLRDVVPHEFLSYTDSPAFKHLDVEVIRAHHPAGNAAVFGGDNLRWPGPHKNVTVWWTLANGMAAAWNENPSIGWSFLLMRLPKPKPLTRVERAMHDIYRIMDGDKVVAFAMKLTNDRWCLSDTNDRRIGKASYKTPKEVALAWDAHAKSNAA